MLPRWVVCFNGLGFQYENGVQSGKLRKFRSNSVGLTEDVDGDRVVVWIIGADERWSVATNETKAVDVLKTGDKFNDKICNICHCLLPIRHFARNQNNIHGIVRRPSCLKCRTDIDKRAPKSRQAKRMEKQRPRAGAPFKCPICQRRSIAGVTAKVVADHDHHTGNIRDFICDSCNTGLGRFKNGRDCLENAMQYLKERDSLGVVALTRGATKES